MSKTYDRSLEEGQLLARGHDHKCRMHKRGEVRAVVLSIVMIQGCGHKICSTPEKYEVEGCLGRVLAKDLRKKTSRLLYLLLT